MGRSITALAVDAKAACGRAMSRPSFSVTPEEGMQLMATKKPMPTLTKPWMSVTDIRDSLSRAREFGAHHARLLDELKGRVAKRREELDATLSDLPPAQRMHIANRALGGLRADLKRTSHDGRIAKLRELDALRRQVSDAKSHYASSVQMLMREGLGGEKRSRLIQQLEHSGPTELASLAAFAVSARDRELAAALVARVNRIPFGERPLVPQELADAILGDEYRAIHAAIGEVESLAERALIEDRAFETGRPSGERMISLALRQRDRADLGDPDAIDTLIDKED